jgi:hypothetical protein
MTLVQSKHNLPVFLLPVAFEKYHHHKIVLTVPLMQFHWSSAFPHFVTGADTEQTTVTKV